MKLAPPSPPVAMSRTKVLAGILLLASAFATAMGQQAAAAAPAGVPVPAAPPIPTALEDTGVLLQQPVSPPVSPPVGAMASPPSGQPGEAPTAALVQGEAPPPAGALPPTAGGVVVDGEPSGSPPTSRFVVPDREAMEHCSSKTACEACVREEEDGSAPCAWVPTLFYGSQPCTQMSCDKIGPDASCYSAGSSPPGKSPAEICPASEEQEEEEEASGDGDGDDDGGSASAGSALGRGAFTLALMAVSTVLA
eukprot:CAMPEP_0197182666 /NCGR_PEP_ID=MMETSP1423-20130617/6547_1 /TAXON_ID=476441 /ORGANISM="Pseudo-nitzschia heimii, Strain UNC1101" /LENGTH=250 /DNA_ID=CAMNT_0042633119 /DNA_START=225 /DNA_END=977 /DNA_ORIENTATION=-